MVGDLTRSDDAAVAMIEPPARPPARIGWNRPVSRLFDGTIAAYQRWLSPLLPAACRFDPSCSQYARNSLAEHMLPRALLLIVWRLLRCQPLCAGGHDPVPPRCVRGSSLRTP